MTTLTLIQNWNLDCGPLSLHLPDDGAGEPFNWQNAYDNGISHAREDSQDCLNADKTWGPKHPDGTMVVDAPGGSGIGFGDSHSNIQANLIASRAKHNRPQRYNREHLIRQYCDDIGGYDKTRNREFAMRLLEYADADLKDATGYGPQGVVSLDTPGWVPNNIHQYYEMAVRAPHEGSPINGREGGWSFFLEAMALKVNPRRNRAYAEMALEACDLAAFVGTGQVCIGPNTGGGPTTPVNVVYAFHQSILAIGACALAFRLDRSLPYWVLDWAESLWGLRKSADYYGSPSCPAFLYTDENMRLQAATGVGQHADPAFAWWSSLCVAIWRFTHDYTWIDRAKKWGPTEATDEQSRKFSQLYRGVTQIPRGVAVP